MKIQKLTDKDINNVSGGGVNVHVGINSPKGHKALSAPDAATKGLLNAFMRVQGNGVELSNIDIVSIT